MKSKTKINKAMKKKTNPDIARAIYLAKKENLTELASLISYPVKKQAKVNLEQINEAKAGAVIVPGKVLSSGDISKKLKVYALGFSEKAKEKLEKAGCEVKTITEVLESKGKLEGELMN